MHISAAPVEVALPAAGMRPSTGCASAQSTRRRRMAEEGKIPANGIALLLLDRRRAIPRQWIRGIAT
jgi:hypothetical protein